MKILIDTNIILDYAVLRQPFYDLADRIFALVEQKQIEGYVSASTFTDLFYIMRKPRGKEWTLNFLDNLANLCQIISIDSVIVKEVYCLFHGKQVNLHGFHCDSDRCIQNILAHLVEEKPKENGILYFFG